MARGRAARTWTEPETAWARTRPVSERVYFDKATVALANKMARMS